MSLYREIAEVLIGIVIFMVLPYSVTSFYLMAVGFQLNALVAIGALYMFFMSVISSGLVKKYNKVRRRFKYIIFICIAKIVFDLFVTISCIILAIVTWHKAERDFFGHKPIPCGLTVGVPIILLILAVARTFLELSVYVLLSLEDYLNNRSNSDDGTYPDNTHFMERFNRQEIEENKRREQNNSSGKLKDILF